MALARCLHGKRVALLRQSTLFFRQPARCHVPRCPGPAHYRAGSIPGCQAGDVDPARFAAPQQPVLHLKARGLAREMRGDRLLPLRPDFGMERNASEKVIAAGEDRAGRETVHLQQARRGLELVAGDDPVPVPLIRGGHHKRVTLLGALQLLLGELARIDVRDRAGDQRRPALGVGENLAARAHPARFTGRVDDAILRLEAFRAPLEAGLNRILDALPVLRMKAGMRLQVGA